MRVTYLAAHILFDLITLIIFVKIASYEEVPRDEMFFIVPLLHLS
jgi:hypothetical protein